MSDDGILGIIPLHFNVEAHYIPVDDFISTAINISEIVKTFNEEIFGSGLRYEIVVLPPKSGTFLSRLGVIVMSVGTAAWMALESDIGKAFVKGATGNEPAYYAEKAGEKAIDIINRFREERKDANLEALSEIVIDSTKGFMKKEYDELSSSGFSKHRFRKAYQAKNEFYQSCYRNQEIRSVGFDETNHFPISRKDFPRLIVDVPTKEDEEEHSKWEVEIEYAQVTSPNWDRRDSQRHWKGRLNKDKPITFIVEDESFWELVEEKSMPTTVRDLLKVQWAFIKEGEKRKSVRVIKVLEINGQILSNPLSDSEVSSILGNYTKNNRKEQDLFGDYDFA